jgi:hypothetical protein
MRSPSTALKESSSEENPGRDGTVVVGVMERTVFSVSKFLESEIRVKVSLPSDPTAALRLPLVMTVRLHGKVTQPHTRVSAVNPQPC